MATCVATLIGLNQRYDATYGTYRLSSFGALSHNGRVPRCRHPPIASLSPSSPQMFAPIVDRVSSATSLFISASRFLLIDNVHGRWTMNVLPLPTVLSSETSPPSSRQSSRTIDRPRPVPRLFARHDAVIRRRGGRRSLAELLEDDLPGPIIADADAGVFDFNDERRRVAGRGGRPR